MWGNAIFVIGWQLFSRSGSEERRDSSAACRCFNFSNSSHFVLIPRAGRRICAHVRHERTRAKSIENCTLVARACHTVHMRTLVPSILAHCVPRKMKICSQPRNSSLATVLKCGGFSSLNLPRRVFRCAILLKGEVELILPYTLSFLIGKRYFKHQLLRFVW